MKEKVCADCGDSKPLSEFGKDKYNNDGLNYDCKECKNRKARARDKANPEQTKARNARGAKKRAAWYKTTAGIETSRRAHLKKMFNITLETYNEMLEIQEGVCAICSKPEMNNVNKVLTVDHNHETGKIRGLLCGLCNMGIGALRDDEQLLKNSIKYLRKYEQ